MPKILLSLIKIEDRQRLDLGDIQGLSQSLKRYGQIQPVVIRQSDNRLVAGGRRCAAATSIGWLDVEFVYKETLTDSELGELELEENVRRKSISWQEQCLAIKKIHEQKTRESHLVGNKWGHRETAEMLGIPGHSNVYTAIKIAGRLEKDTTRQGTIWKCESVADAVRVVLKEQEDEAIKLLMDKEKTTVKSTLDEYDDPQDVDMSEAPTFVEDLNTDALKEEARERYLSNHLNDPNEFDSYWLSKLALNEKKKEAALTVPLSKQFLNIDAIEFMRTHTDFCDHIITDIPYGIDMDMLEQSGTGMDVSAVKDEHDVQDNLNLFDDFFFNAFSCVKDQGFVITWCDQIHWQKMYDLAVAAGFKVQRWPITWVKTHSCLNQAAQYNFTKNTEIAIVCRKGNATLASTASECVVTASNTEVKKLLGGHPFVKPFEVTEFLASKCTRQGDLVYEPFVGRGSIAIGLLRMGRRVVGTELQETHYAHLMENMKGYYKRMLGEEVKFV